MTETKKVHQQRLGKVVATIWEKTGRDGKTLRRTKIGSLYKDGDGKWKQATSFWPNELPLVARLAEEAFAELHKPKEAAREKSESFDYEIL